MPTLDAKPLACLASESLPQRLRELIEAAPMPGLGDGPRDEALAHSLATRAPYLAQIPQTGLAGLWLLAGDLDASHRISQAIDDRDGSFWHGIMHRREGDYANAKYWFRRVGPHPVLDQLASTPYGDPLRFVDACQSVSGSNRGSASSAADQPEQLQWLEWQLLFAHCLA